MGDPYSAAAMAKIPYDIPGSFREGTLRMVIKIVEKTEKRQRDG
jgi:hypothetical protein